MAHLHHHTRGVGEAARTDFWGPPPHRSRVGASKSRNRTAGRTPNNSKPAADVYHNPFTDELEPRCLQRPSESAVSGISCAVFPLLPVYAEIEIPIVPRPKPTGPHDSSLSSELNATETGQSTLGPTPQSVSSRTRCGKDECNHLTRPASTSSHTTHPVALQSPAPQTTADSPTISPDREGVLAETTQSSPQALTALSSKLGATETGRSTPRSVSSRTR